MATVGSVSGITTKTGIGGLASGMDIDSLILKMTAASRLKVTKQEQSLQKLEWKQSAYQSVTKALMEFRDKYFNSLSATNFKSSNLYNIIRATVPEDTKAFTATATSTATAGKAVVNKIEQLATSQTITNNKEMSGELEGVGTFKLNDLKGKDFMVTLDGVSRTVTFDNTFMNDLQNIVRDDLLAKDASSGSYLYADASGTITDGVALDAAVADIMNTYNRGEHSAEINGYLSDAIQVGVNRVFENPPASGSTYQDYLAISNPKISVTAPKIGTSTSTTTSGGVTTTVTYDVHSIRFDARDGSKLTLGYATAPATVSERDADTETVAEYNDRVVRETAANHKATGLGALGFTDKQSNRLDVYSSIADLRSFDEMSGTFKMNGHFAPPNPTLSPDGTSSNNYVFIINDVRFSVSEDESLYSVMNKINSSAAGVTLSYSEVTDKFTLTSKQQGAGENIVMGDTNGNLLAALGLVNSDYTYSYTQSDGTQKTTVFSNDHAAPTVYGQNAIAYIDGQKIERTSNEFTVNGVAYALKELYNETWDPTTGAATSGTTVTLASNATDLTETVKNFVTDYNALVDLLHGLTNEETFSDYEPLTEEQRAAMSESQIKLWEEKAKSGILRSDGTVNKILASLRESFLSSVDGFGLFNMGITYGTATDSWKSYGKLTISDEAKLKSVLESQPDRVRAFFTDASKGVATKIDKVLDDAVRTTGGSGHRGSLIEIAGWPSTLSETENSLYTQMTNHSKRITTLKEQLEKEESRLWAQFTAMEEALSKLNEQQSYLAQYLGQKSS